MRKTPLITIIVPVYKVESFLDQCINSIINQTYKNLEIILVDDGSPDKCPQMCDDFAKKDSRISVIHKENGGLSDARNTATKIAAGEYIAYIDSDDWVNETYIEKLYSLLLENNADISVCDNIRFKEDFSEESLIDESFQKKNKEKITVLSNLEAIKYMFYQKTFETNAHGKLYKSHIAKKFLYPKGRLYEDLFTTYKMLFIANKVVYSNEKLYYYRDNPDGIMNKKFTTKMFDELDAADEIEAFVKEHCPELLPAAYSRKFSAYSQVLRWTKDAPNTPEIQEKRDYIWNFLKQYQWKMFADKNARIKNRIAPIIMLLGQKKFMKF